VGQRSEATRRLQRLQGGEGDFPTQVEKAFGQPLYIYLSRKDKVSQAISLIRAEQSGLWHLNVDGSVYEGRSEQQPQTYDADNIAATVAKLDSDDAAWAAFFAETGIKPLRLTYEGNAADPQSALAKVLSVLGRDPAIASTVAVPTRKMADDTSREWRERFQVER